MNRVCLSALALGLALGEADAACSIEPYNGGWTVTSLQSTPLSSKSHIDLCQATVSTTAGTSGLKGKIYIKCLDENIPMTITMQDKPGCGVTFTTPERYTITKGHFSTDGTSFIVDNATSGDKMPDYVIFLGNRKF